MSSADDDDSSTSSASLSVSENSRQDVLPPTSSDKVVVDNEQLPFNDDNKEGEETADADEQKNNEAAKRAVDKSPSQKDASLAKKAGTKKKKQKMKRSEVELEWKRDRYQKLHHQATKEFTKVSKQVKQFLCQKVIRKLKQQEEDKEAEKSKTISTTMTEQELATMKAFDVTVVVQQSLKQLGMSHLDPDWSPESSTNETGGALDSQKQVIDKYMQHKKMTTALEAWNDKVTEYRRWCLKLDEKNDPFYEAPKKSKKRRKKGNGQPVSEQEVSLDTSTFCSLGGNDAQENQEANEDMAGHLGLMSAYGPGAYLDDDGAMFVPKKNRKGQRARRAKAQALEAKKAGRKYVSSNWREPKKASGDLNEDHNQHSQRPPERQRTNDKSGSKFASKNSNAEQKDAAQAHPSWAAKQNQSSGIVAFQGKKITF